MRGRLAFVIWRKEPDHTCVVVTRMKSVCSAPHSVARRIGKRRGAARIG